MKNNKSLTLVLLTVAFAVTSNDSFAETKVLDRTDGAMDIVITGKNARPQLGNSEEPTDSAYRASSNEQVDTANNENRLEINTAAPVMPLSTNSDADSPEGAQATPNRLGVNVTRLIASPAIDVNGSTPRADKEQADNTANNENRPKIDTASPVMPLSTYSDGASPEEAQLSPNHLGVDVTRLIPSPAIDVDRSTPTADIAGNNENGPEINTVTTITPIMPQPTNSDSGYLEGAQSTPKHLGVDITKLVSPPNIAADESAQAAEVTADESAQATEVAADGSAQATEVTEDESAQAVEVAADESAQAAEVAADGSAQAVEFTKYWPAQDSEITENWPAQTADEAAAGSGQ